MKTDDTLWAITTYFNPVQYRSRRRNFSVFRELLPVPLIAIEYSVDTFELGEGDADILIQLRGQDALWQKERLYNIARRHLPPHCEQVLWIDCDIVLGGTDWQTELKESLNHHSLIQPFHRLALLGPGVNPPHERDDQVVDWRISLVAYLATGGRPSDVFTRWGTSLTRKYFHGGVWAARRSFCDSFDYYDRMIVGGGDKLFSGAVYGQAEAVAASIPFGDDFGVAYRAWADAFRRAMPDEPGFLETTAYHLWHGSISNRGYDDRLGKLRGAGFQAFEDLAIDPETQCWRWATDKPALHEHVRGHFVRRREDG